MDKQDVRLYRHMCECERFIRARYNMWHSRGVVLSEYTTMAMTTGRLCPLNYIALTAPQRTTCACCVLVCASI